MRPPLPAGAALVVALVMAGCQEKGAASSSPPVEPMPRAADVPLGSGFDFYVLALSWSPSYCASEGDRANRQQCGARPSHGFVVHGLWPQFAQGYPADCETELPLSVERSMSDTMLDIMPSTGLVRHQWKKHGTCTGLSQADYFSVTRMARDRIAVPANFVRRDAHAALDPDDVEGAFIAANPDMPADAVAVTCDRRFLREVRICLSKDMTAFVSCPEVDRKDCPRDSAIMPPTP
ncbi:ribonuclease T2 family protein [Oricola cellulosilytica]|uniref:Ribonuclease n=1 Tax=Oricola cellulosilytica TaxID=1429082 RepID=A0A4V2MPH3_9HYPH|nr:ribonuclease [Oricola cellulosilytica]TCD14327.1 ribonuclease [Oricola cellulosilytica]